MSLKDFVVKVLLMPVLMALSIGGIWIFGARYLHYLNISRRLAPVQYVYSGRELMRNKRITYYMKAAYKGHVSRVAITRNQYVNLASGMLPPVYPDGAIGLFSLEDQNNARRIMIISILILITLLLVGYAHFLKFINRGSKRRQGN